MLGGVDVLDLLLAAQFECERALTVARVRVVHGQVPDEVALVGELPVALAAHVGLLLGRLGGVVRIVIEVLVPAQQLLLPVDGFCWLWCGSIIELFCRLVWHGTPTSEATQHATRGYKRPS